MVHPVQMGKRTRMSFARIEEALAVPDLIEVQKNSYKSFLKEGLREVLADVSPITDYSESLILEFIDYSLDDAPKYTVDKCKERDATFAAPLKVKVRLTNRETHEIKESDVFMGDFPLMTENGTFIINGAERVIVSQLVRSPGAYYAREIDKTGTALYSSQMIPNRGAWIEYETDGNDIIFARIDRARKLPMTTLLHAIDVDGRFETDEAIIDLFGSDPRVMATLARDAAMVDEQGNLRMKTRRNQALIEVYNKLRPGEPPSVDSATSLLNALFYDPKRYDLAHVGRYKYNRKLSLCDRISNRKAAEDIVHPYTGEIIVAKGEVIARETAKYIQNTGINSVFVVVDDQPEPFRVLGNNFAFLKPFLQNYSAEMAARYDESVAPIRERVHVPTLLAVLKRVEEDGLELNQALKEAQKDLVPKHILNDDILASMSYHFGLFHGIGDVDDIDHLGNRRLRSVGELLQNQIRVGLSRLERVVKERMAIQDTEKVRPQDLINIRPVSAAIKEFFGSSQLSQFMDQPNPLAELTHKRRLSALGPG
ncbi:MAG: DNA-directed RNA polymerase subunit beta, partial [Clostridia bacterium]|nr:DNA-directed RNA polymerase subunit beta [Clostridia bacterium]